MLNCIIATMRAEIRNEAPEHAGLIHAPQHDLGHVAREQDFEKQPIGFLVGAQIGVDAAQRARHRAHGVGMQRQAVMIGHPEQPDDVDGIALEHIVVDDADAVVVDR